MPLTPIFHPQEDWYQAMVTKNKGSLKAKNRQEEWYEEIVDSMSSGGSVGGGVLVVHDVDGTLDKTWQEIHNAFVSGGVRIVNEDEYGTEFVITVNGTESGDDSGEWAVYTSNTGNFAPHHYTTTSADGYPTN